MKLSDADLVPANMGKSTLQQIITQNFPFYTFVDVDLKNGDTEIDESLDGLLMHPAGARIWSRRSCVASTSSSSRASRSRSSPARSTSRRAIATMNATLATHGLEKLLGGYGIDLHKDVVPRLRAQLPRRTS